jgi:hypothetical protein
MATNFPSIDPTCNNHTDPGRNWAWNHYMQLVLTGSAPAIVTQTISVVRNPGETAAFSVMANGDPPLHYQWLFDGGILVNATNASLFVSNVQISVAGAYSVQVRNASGAVTSEVAYLNVNLPATPVGTGSGLLAGYFDREDFSVPHFSRVDSTVNFDWGASGPTVSMGDDHFSVRWVGQVEPRYSQRYSFYVRSDDGARLWVNGQLLVDRLDVQPTTEWKGLIDLEAGRRYDLRLDYFDRTGNAGAALSWSSASQVKQIVPRYQLHPPSLALGSTNLLFGYGQPAAAFIVTSVDPDPAVGGILWNVDFESFPPGSPNGTILFRAPSYSGTTSAFLDGGTNYTIVTDAFPAGHAGSRVIKSSWSFAPGMPGPWLRLTTAGAPQIPNPAVILGQAVRFELWTDRPLRVGFGIRETTNSAAAGDDGGLSGPIEFVGVAGVTNGTPYPARLISPGNWVTVQFNLPIEPVSRFTGDGVIARDGSGTLEHLSLVPADGSGRYTVYIDDVQVVKANTVTYSLIDPPAGVGIDEITGRITWNTGEIAIPATNSIRVRISNQVFPPMAVETNVVLVTLPMPSPILRLVGGGAGEGERVCELRWDSIVGYAYRVQFNEQLGATGWSDLGGPLRADGSTAVMRETMPAGKPSRFYRVLGIGAWADGESGTD